MLKKACFSFRAGIIFAICAVFLLTACGGTSDLGEVVFCTEDAKICPDGSAVSRIPPDCEFAACATISMTAQKQITLSEIPIYDCGPHSDDQRRCPVVGDTVAKLSTSEGDIWIKFFPELTPKTFENFVGLSERGFYNGLIFHRVIPDFMVQGGDPLGTGTGGESIWGGEFKDEFSQLQHHRGALSMANRGSNTNTSQFFIVQAREGTMFLNGRHTVFAQVVSGLSTTDDIVNVEKDASDKPLEDIKMEVEVFEVVE